MAVHGAPGIFGTVVGDRCKYGLVAGERPLCRTCHAQRNVTLHGQPASDAAMQGREPDCRQYLRAQK